MIKTKKVFFAMHLALFSCLSAVYASIPLPSSSSALILLNASDYEVTQAVIQRIWDEGGHPAHVFPPNIIIAYMPNSLDNVIHSLSSVKGVYRESVSIELAEGDAVAASGIAAWNYLLEPQDDSSVMPEPLINDVLTPPIEETIKGVKTVVSKPNYNTTSYYMVGKIALGIVLPESSGANGGTNTENWSSSRMQTVVNEIVQGMNWWVTKGGTSARLTFYYDQQLAIPTQYEPITLSTDSTWIGDTLANMGYTATGHWNKTKDYINNLRNTLQTDWTYCFFIADSLNDTDGKFPTGYFGYAYLGGPYSVMTYDNNGYGINNMDVVARHETGHIFLAGDEYCSPGYACCDFSYYGYLRVYNGNCELDNPNSVSCVMKNNSNAICSYTNGQIGWTDTDADGKPDVIDNVVSNTLNQPTSPTTNPVATVTGTARDMPYDSPSYTDITINSITDVKVRINNGAWVSATAVDGAYNDDQESYTYTTPPLNWGSNTIETQAFSSSGNTSSIQSKTVVVGSTVSGKLTFNFNTGAPPSPVLFEFRNEGETVPFYSISANIASDGSYSLIAPSKKFVMSVKHQSWLRKNITVDATGGAISGANITLLNGDANRDNAVDDMDVLLTAEQLGQSGSDLWADLNRSGSVDSADLTYIAIYLTRKGEQ